MKNISKKVLTVRLQSVIVATVDKMTTQNNVERGNVSMINLQYIDEKVKESGLRKGYIAEQLGLTRAGLHSKLTGRTSITMEEGEILLNLLHINTAADRRKIFTSDVDN